jgi:hypothetical protein
MHLYYRSNTIKWFAMIVFVGIAVLALAGHMLLGRK